MKSLVTQLRCDTYELKSMRIIATHYSEIEEATLVAYYRAAFRGIRLVSMEPGAGRSLIERWTLDLGECQTSLVRPVPVSEGHPDVGC